MDGVAAALMGFTDFAPPDDMLGGERGFFSVFSDGVDAEKLCGEADWFEIERIYVKPYASCRHSHSAVEAAIRLHPDLAPDAIESVLVETYRLGVKGHDHSEIAGIASAKLSTPYAVACALLHGRADLSLFEPLDAAALELARKVRVVENEDFSRQSAGKRVAAVTVCLTDGTSLREQVDYAKGEPENPMTTEELRRKREMLEAYSPAMEG
jgi:2-methylcitrate dehydratase PrpD